MGDLSAHSLLTPCLLTHLCLFRQSNLSNNRLFGVWDELNAFRHKCKQKGNYNAEGINAIADALRVNGALTKLSIDGNHVGDKGVGAICEAILSNKETKLASLNMAGNSIGQVGAKSVATMVAATGALTKIE